jgi:hypothetical protein
LLLLILTGCAENGSDFTYLRMAPSAPPEPVFEEKIRSDDPQNEYWRPGFWNYDGLTFDWVPGSLIARPDPTAVWIPDRWELREFGWAFVPGYWQ